MKVILPRVLAIDPKHDNNPFSDSPALLSRLTPPSLYSFTFVKDGENWMIVDHHSSAMPAPPR
jgi:hypothetical protein